MREVYCIARLALVSLSLAASLEIICTAGEPVDGRADVRQFDLFGPTLSEIEVSVAALNKIDRADTAKLSQARKRLGKANRAYLEAIRDMDVEYRTSIARDLHGEFELIRHKYLADSIVPKNFSSREIKRDMLRLGQLRRVIGLLEYRE